MRIGVPKEIKPQEARVGLTPAGALTLIRSGHQVSIQKGAGLLSGISDEAYFQVGCELVDDIESIYLNSEMIIKVKEPIQEEYALIQKGQLLVYLFSLCFK
jgi:alanine dehydrogenase